VKFYQNYCKISFVCSFPDNDACVLVEKYEPEDEDDDDGYFRTDESCPGEDRVNETLTDFSCRRPGDEFDIDDEVLEHF
jgi:hypothetical protein